MRDIVRKKLRILAKKYAKVVDYLFVLQYTDFVEGRRIVRISYKKLWIMLIEKDVSPASLRKDLNIATGTMTKMRRNEEVALSVLLRICGYLNCNIGDICDAIREDDEPKI